MSGIWGMGQSPQGDIYSIRRMWPNIWGLAKFLGDYQEFGGVNPKYLATAKSGGIFFEISPFRDPPLPARSRISEELKVYLL